MKTTVEIPDDLFARAKKRAKAEGSTMRSLMIEGLRRVLDAREDERREAYRLPDRGVGDSDAPDPLVDDSWSELRDEIYGGR